MGVVTSQRVTSDERQEKPKTETVELRGVLVKRVELFAGAILTESEAGCGESLRRVAKKIRQSLPITADGIIILSPATCHGLTRYARPFQTMTASPPRARLMRPISGSSATSARYCSESRRTTTVA